MPKRPVRRIAKQEFKHDRFVTLAFEAVGYFQHYRTRILLGSLSVVVLVGSAIYYVRARAHQGEQALQEFLTIQTNFATGNTALAINDLTQFLTRYAGTRLADDGLFFLGSYQLQMGKVEEAIATLKTFLDRYKDSPFRWAAFHALAAAHRENREFDRAAETALAALPAAYFPFQRAELLLAAGRDFALAGEKNRAKEIFQRILAEYPKEAAAGESRMRLAELDPPTVAGVGGG